MLGNRLRKRAKHLRKWARRQGVSCYRLYDRDIPEIALVIDWYEGRLHIARYRADGEAEPDQSPDQPDWSPDQPDWSPDQPDRSPDQPDRSPDQPDRSPDSAPDREGHAAPGGGADPAGSVWQQPGWMDAMVAAAAEALAVAPEWVYVKARRRQRGLAQYERQEQTDERITAHEGGHRFIVNLRDYLDTGLFLDHRPMRARIGREAAGGRFLNLFCYTGAFTVYAAAGGARESVSVDLSNTYLDWARDNLAQNQLRDPAHRLIRADVFDYLGSIEGGFDLAVLDPPTFSNSKKMRGVLDVQRDHVGLIQRTLALLRPGGVLYFSTNARRFQLAAERLQADSIEDITASTIDEDFRPHPRPHRVWRLVR